MKKLVSGIIGTQEMFELDEPLTINREFSEVQATEMAYHRSRRIGNLALTEPTKGFRRMVSGLWVPHSGTENVAVVRNPKDFMMRNSEFVRDKVFEKYLGDGSEQYVSETRVAAWASFAANNQRSKIANQFNGWRQDARDKGAAMNPGFSTEGKVLRHFVESSPEVMGSIAAYLADLKSYIGHPDMMRGVKRTWMQDIHSNQQATHREWTKQLLWTQPDWEFDRWVAESYYNHRSRAKFWYEVLQKSEQMREDIAIQKRIHTWREDMTQRGYDVDSL